jgi:hypothetical protein
MSLLRQKELLDEVFKDSTVSRPLKTPCENDTILSLCRQDLISLFTLELGNLDWRHADKRPSCLSKSNPFIASRFIYKHEMVRAEC